jgi:hypothetical protein
VEMKEGECVLSGFGTQSGGDAETKREADTLSATSRGCLYIAEFDPARSGATRLGGFTLRLGERGEVATASGRRIIPPPPQPLLSPTSTSLLVTTTCRLPPPSNTNSTSLIPGQLLHRPTSHTPWPASTTTCERPTSLSPTHHPARPLHARVALAPHSHLYPCWRAFTP